MKSGVTSPSSVRQKPIRIWSGVIIVILQWLVRFVLPEIFPGFLSYGVFGGLIFGLALAIWWFFFSRALWTDRILAAVVTVAALSATFMVLDKSIATTMMGLMFPVFSVPVLSLGFVAWAAATRGLNLGLRRITMIAAILVFTGFWALLRTNGMDSQTHQRFAWRWSKTREERLLSKAESTVKKSQTGSDITSEAGWPGFRGRNRNGLAGGIKIRSNWSEKPPVELWHKAIGPGCSSFAVWGNLIYTQEQRGEFEAVTCYDLGTGDLVWIHQDSTRFWDAHAGAGPRSTPTIADGRLYSLGAKGIVNVLDARDGSVIWTRNAAGDTKAEVPGWAYCGSPLVADSTVYVATSGEMAAYDIANGNLRWTGSDGGESYSSPHLITIDGSRQIIFMNKSAITSFAPEDGRVLWKLPMNGPPIIQPVLLNETDLLLSNASETGGTGVRRVSLKNSASGWTTSEVWTSDQLKPYFNDMVTHKGFAYSFDGPYLVCLDTENGNRMWKGGRYSGELILFPDQDLLLVLSEKGEIALVSASPEKFAELGKINAIKGRTWNHPAMAGNILLVRNGDEMAAFRL
jgi:outer membrane protein assembly factor BamB